ncbi:MAG TPA: CHAT domain-containing tetratricopeptide repeat protein [Balneolales bacterium]|nr:CHAT domain-containing tetratricopeptide repeat protein [Balneolales bacterium]
MGIQNHRSEFFTVFSLLTFFLVGNYASVAHGETVKNKIIAHHTFYHVKSDTALINRLTRKAKRQYREAHYNASILDFKRLYNIYNQKHNIGEMALSEAHIAHVYAGKGDFTKALHSVHLIKNLLKHHQSHIKAVAKCKIYEYLGRVYQAKEENKKTKYYYTKSLQIYQNNHLIQLKTLTNIFNEIGSYYSDQGNYKLALDYLLQAERLGLAILPPKSSIITDIYNNLGIVNNAIGNYNKSLNYYKKDLKTSIQILGKNHPDIAVTYNNIGSIYIRLGDLDNALDYYKKSLRIFLKKLGPDHLKVGVLYNNIGAIYYYKKNYKTSIQYFRRSLEIKLHKLGPDNNNVAVAYVNIGSIYEENKNYDRALYYYKKALRIKRNLYGSNSPRVSASYDGIGNVYQKEKRYSNAIKYFAKELKININSLGFNHPYTAKTLINIGTVYQSEKKYDEALDFYQRSLMSLVPDFHSENLNDNPHLNDIRSKNSLLTALKDKANALYLRYNSNKEHIQDLKLSVKTYNTITLLINKMREGYKTKGSKLFLGKISFKIFEKGIRATLELYDKTHNPAYKKLAFVFSERSKSNVLLESIIDSKAKKYAGIPIRLLKKEKKLKENLTYYNNHLEEELNKKDKADSTKINHWQDKLFAGNRAYHAFIRRLEKEYPRYYHLKYDIPKISVTHIQRNIVDKKSAIVSYFKGDSTLYIFVITHHNFQIFKQKLSSNFNKKIIAVRKGITSNNYKLYATNAFDLYKTLIYPESNLIAHKRLIIIPEGLLGYLPFEALLTKKPPSVKNADYSIYRKLPYLILSHTISYTYSTSLLEELQSRSTIHDSHQFLGMAPVFDQKHNHSVNYYAVRGDSLNHLSPLLASAHEVKDIYHLFQKNRGFFKWLPYDESTVYLRNKATESILKSPKISEYKYIHLATHAFIDEKNPSMSGIILARNHKSVNDGVLYSSEIYNLNLNAKLVVLSACETAMGKYVKGEGITGLARSFIYAGANNLIVSLWNVSDRSTSQLMIHFYSNLLKRHKIYSSLCKAKKEMILNSQYSAPIYWSPFILIGNN